MDNNIPEGYIAFDYEEALKRPDDVRTRDGREVKIAGCNPDAFLKLTGWIKSEEDGWANIGWLANGRHPSYGNLGSNKDLFLLPKTREVFQNLYPHGRFVSPHESLSVAINSQMASSRKEDLAVAVLKITYTGDKPTAVEIVHHYEAKEAQKP